MPLILPGNVGSATAATGFDVANSVRFQNAQLLRTNSGSTSTNIDKYTISVWLKRSKLGVDSNIIADTDGSNNYYQIYFKSDDTIRWQEYHGSGESGALITNRKFRDVGAWYNLIFRYDSSLGTAGDRMRMYVNGVEETSFSTDVNPSQNANGHFGEASSQKCIADNNADGREYFGYMCEFMGVDGQSLAPDQFGEFDSDSGIWKPIDISGITQGVHGFYLKFEDSSDLGVATLGSNWTGAGLAATDQSTDTCTNNFCTMNSLENYYQAATLTEGNLKLLTATTSNVAPSLATFALTKGKWYYEAKYVSDSLAVSAGAIGIVGNQITSATAHAMLETAQKYGLYLSDGDIWHNNSKVQELGAHVDHTATIGIALDFDNNRITFSKDGSWGDGSGNWDESSPHTYYTIAAPSTVDFQAYFPAFGDWSSGSIGYEINFGSPIYSISSGNQDANGYGNFEYAVPSGYYTLCTKNLAEFG